MTITIAPSPRTSARKTPRKASRAGALPAAPSVAAPAATASHAAAAAPISLTAPISLAAPAPAAPLVFPTEPGVFLPMLPPGAQRGSRRKGVAFEKSKCGSCIALCCRYFALEVDRPTVPADFENLRWYLLHERVNVFVEGRRWYIQIFSKCQALGSDNRCTIYETRPAICREYDNDVCDKDEALGESTSDQLFRTIGELEAYRDTWVARYKAKQRRERRAAAARRTRKRRRTATARASGAKRSTRATGRSRSARPRSAARTR